MHAARLRTLHLCLKAIHPQHALQPLAMRNGAVQGDCFAAPPRVRTNRDEVRVRATPPGACRLLTSEALLYLPNADAVGATAVQPPQDAWMHNLHLAQVNGTLVSEVSLPGLVAWAPASASRLWLTQMAAQTQASSWGFVGASVFVAGAHAGSAGCMHVMFSLAPILCA